MLEHNVECGVCGEVARCDANHGSEGEGVCVPDTGAAFGHRCTPPGFGEEEF